jgi:hypothetical protein
MKTQLSNELNSAILNVLRSQQHRNITTEEVVAELFGDTVRLIDKALGATDGEVDALWEQVIAERKSCWQSEGPWSLASSAPLPGKNERQWLIQVHYRPEHYISRNGRTCPETGYYLLRTSKHDRPKRLKRAEAEAQADVKIVKTSSRIAVFLRAQDGWKFLSRHLDPLKAAEVAIQRLGKLKGGARGAVKPAPCSLVAEAGSHND